MSPTEGIRSPPSRKGGQIPSLDGKPRRRETPAKGNPGEGETPSTGEPGPPEPAEPGAPARAESRARTPTGR